MQNLQDLHGFGESESSCESHISMADSEPNNSEEDYVAMVTRSTRPKKGTSGRRKKNQKVRKERHVIQHDYHDHAFDPVDFDEYVLDQDPSSVLKKKGGVGTPFPLKLHALLEKSEEDGLTDIVSWQPHGRAFVVHQPKKFVVGIMHKFFRQTKLTSFQRQLNLYGFNRLTKGADSGGYYHELFVRGRPYLTNRMVRTKIKGTGFKAASNPDCEPDFYHMTPVDSPCPPTIDSSSTGKNVSRDDILPIVTPTETSFATQTDMQLPPLSEVFDTGRLQAGDSPGKHVPFLGKRINTKRVRLGNQSFQYMEHMDPMEPLQPHYPAPSSSNISPIEENTNNSPSIENTNISPGAEHTNIDEDTISISPTIFDSSFHDDSQETDSDSRDVDPLSVFLAEIGDDFEDDIDFSGGLGSCNSIAEV